jgi:triosephosphate isomerase
VDIVVCPPFTALEPRSAKEAHSGFPTSASGAQNMSEHNFGAFTGEIAAGMLKEFSVRYVILGHSERRQYPKGKRRVDFQKSPRRPRRLAQAHRLRRRNAGGTRRRPDGKSPETQVRGSLAGLTAEQMEFETIIAYEPVWAIGTGKTPPPPRRRRRTLSSANCWPCLTKTVARRVRIQYGGSVKPANARELMEQPDVDGALVGGASLDARSFSDIIKNSI